MGLFIPLGWFQLGTMTANVIIFVIIILIGSFFVGGIEGTTDG